jgi:hypothetical protein
MGMHRSGTSFAASALRFLGVSLGDPARHMPPGGDNPAGYFELQSVMELNEELLAHLGGAWDAPPVLDPGWERDGGLESFRERAAKVLDDAFAPGAPGAAPATIAWKDPRLSLLLPFWRTVMPVQATIVLVRSPLEVAASLASRKYTVDAPQAAGLWLRYLYAAVASDPAHLMVRYRDCFTDLRGTLTAIAAHIGAPPPTEDAIDAAGEHLDPSLRHHEHAAPSPDLASPLMDIALAVWNDGAVDLAVLPPVVADACARGWLRPPQDGELLARARAETVRLRETLRARNRQDELRAQQ